MLLSICQPHTVMNDVVQQQLDVVMTQLDERTFVNVPLSVKAVRANSHPARTAPMRQHPVSCGRQAKVAPRRVAVQLIGLPVRCLGRPNCLPARRVLRLTTAFRCLLTMSLQTTHYSLLAIGHRDNLLWSGSIE